MSDSLYARPGQRDRACGWSKRGLTLVDPRRRRGSTPTVFEPPTDVYETAEELVVRMEIAGLAADEVEVSLAADGSALNVAGRRADPASGQPRKYYTMEIECGDFYRQIPLPVPVDPARVTASYAEGFLEIRLPKAQPLPPRSRQVPVQ